MVSDTDLAMISEKIILKPSIKQDLLGRVRAFNRADAARKWLIDDAITSRFGAEIELFLPDAAERREIQKLEVLELGRSIEVPQFLAEETAGFSGRGLARLASDVFRRARVSGETITESLWRDAMEHRRPG